LGEVTPPRIDGRRETCCEASRERSMALGFGLGSGFGSGLCNGLGPGRSGGTARFEALQWLARKWGNYAPSHHNGKLRRLPHLSEASDFQFPTVPHPSCLQKPISYALICQ
jgi:hypothetical protein